MIELIVKEHLSAALDVPVVLEVPRDPPASYVVIEKLGGRQDNHIDRAGMAVQSCSTSSLYEAAVLNESVKAAMEDLASNPSVSRCRLNSDYNFTDKKTKTYRYQAVYDLVFFE